MDSETREEGIHPRGKMVWEARLCDILCMHYPSMIAQLTSEDLHHLVESALTVTSGQTIHSLYQVVNHVCGKHNLAPLVSYRRKHYHHGQDALWSQHWIIASQLPYSVFWHPGFLFWLCNQHAYFRRWVSWAGAQCILGALCLTCMFVFHRAARQDPACAQISWARGPHRGTGKSRFLSVDLCKCVSEGIWARANSVGK